MIIMLQEKIRLTYIITGIAIILIVLLNHSPIIPLVLSIYVLFITLSIKNKTISQVIFSIFLVLYLTIRTIMILMLNTGEPNPSIIIDLHYVLSYFIIFVTFSAIALFMKKSKVQIHGVIAFILCALLSFKYIILLSDIYEHLMERTNVPLIMYPIGEFSPVFMYSISVIITLFIAGYVRYLLLETYKESVYEPKQLDKSPTT